jgi:hypothetical protein
MSKVYRIHIRPGGGLANSKISFEYCLKQNVLGVGWQVPTESDEKLTWEQYEERALTQYKNIQVVRYFKNRIKEGDLLWTRGIDGSYYLARALSAWEYYDNDSARDADIVNICHVKMLQISNPDDVPGKVISCFRASRTIQEICDDSIATYSQGLWNRMDTEFIYTIQPQKLSWRSLLTDEQLEDLLFIYLQLNDWIVVPNSRKKDTMSYEFYLIHKTTKERAIVQAKTGYSQINLDNLVNCASKVYVYQTHGIYSGKCGDNVTIISDKEIEGFVKEYEGIIPANISKWFSIQNSVEAQPQSS